MGVAKSSVDRAKSDDRAATPSFTQSGRGVEFPNYNVGASELEERVGIADLALFVQRAVPSMLCCTIAAMMVGIVYINYTPPTYVARSKVLIDPKVETVSRGGDIGVFHLTLDSSKIETQIQVIRSEQTSRSVVRELDLQNDPELSAVGPSVLMRVFSWFRESSSEAR